MRVYNCGPSSSSSSVVARSLTVEPRARESSSRSAGCARRDRRLVRGRTPKPPPQTTLPSCTHTHSGAGARAAQIFAIVTAVSACGVGGTRVHWYTVLVLPRVYNVVAVVRPHAQNASKRLLLLFFFLLPLFPFFSRVVRPVYTHTHTQYLCRRPRQSSRLRARVLYCTFTDAQLFRCLVFVRGW